jgi:glycine/D-amino acid oxidase-like deaminating enzyme
VVNAAGGWSAKLFAPLGVQVPVALEPVYAANWLVSSGDLPENLPIIADYVNRAYFRRWVGSTLHMHQPRQRKLESIKANFGHSLMNTGGADIVYEAGDSAASRQESARYAEIVRDRFPSIGAPIYAGGYVSYFDITPDLKFILGRDTQIPNLIHCLGAGQALKYAPIFGELMSELIVEGKTQDFDLTEFSIQRFANRSLEEFWPTETFKGKQNAL